MAEELGVKFVMMAIPSEVMVATTHVRSKRVLCVKMAHRLFQMFVGRNAEMGTGFRMKDVMMATP
jgi:hypothetical protein